MMQQDGILPPWLVGAGRRALGRLISASADLDKEFGRGAADEAYRLREDPNPERILAFFQQRVAGGDFGRAMEAINVLGDGAEEPLTDVSNCRLLVKNHGEDLRYCKAFGWLQWDGGRWAECKVDEQLQLAINTMEILYKEAQELGSWATTPAARHTAKASVLIVLSDRSRRATASQGPSRA